MNCGARIRREDLGLQPMTAPARPQPRPRYNAATVPHAQRLSVVAGKRTHGKLYEIFMFEIAGILSLFIPPIFGLPSLTYLAVALMTFIPLYSVLPSESQVVGSLGGGRITREAGGQIGSLMTKSISKIIAFAFIIFQFYVSFFTLRIICVAVSFLFYFSMKTSYRTSQPYNMVEAWFRMGLGGFIAWILAVTFGGMGPGVGIGLVFLWMGLAFFLTLPVHIQDQENGVVNISFLNDISGSKSFQYTDKFLFSVMMFGSLIFFLSSTGGGMGVDRIMFYAFFGLSWFVGVSTGPEGRPVLGIVMIFILMFVLTTSYPGYVGSAVFGYWWPQIQSFTSAYMGPLNTAWAQAQSSMGDAWEMMTCPQCYYQKQLMREQATKSVIMTGGTPMSIEISKFELIPSLAGTLEPSEPTIGDMELNNQGDFTSGNILLEFWTSRVDAVNLKDISDSGEVTNLHCSSNPEYSDSTSLGGTAYCNWKDTKTYPKETRVAIFKLEGGSLWGDIYSNCTYNGNVLCTCFAGGCVVNTTYSHSGQTVKVNANLTYDYVVNVSMPITIINNETYLKKLQANEMVLQDLTSEYTGGPIKATLYTQKQPARTDVPFLVVASIYNDGSGELLNITDFTITVYKGDNVVDDVEFLGTTFRNYQPTINNLPDGCGTDPIGPVGPTFDSSTGNFVLSCSNNWGTLKQGEFKRISFYIYPNTSIDDEKTTQIVGWAQYRYRKTTSQTLIIANAPPQ
jgi:hypothetical protein